MGGMMCPGLDTLGWPDCNLLVRDNYSALGLSSNAARFVSRHWHSLVPSQPRHSFQRWQVQLPLSVDYRLGFRLPW